jgi:hypothetical protein
MLPRIQAEESLRHVSEIAVGTGSLKSADRRSILKEWQQAMWDKKIRKKLSIDQQKIMLAAMGVKLECRKS